MGKGARGGVEEKESENFFSYADDFFSPCLRKEFQALCNGQDVITEGKSQSGIAVALTNSHSYATLKNSQTCRLNSNTYFHKPIILNVPF